MATVASEQANTEGDVAKLNEMVASLQAKLLKRDEALARHKAAYENLLLAYERLRRQIFGKMSEKLTPEQMSIAWDAALKEVALTGAVPPGDAGSASTPASEEASSEKTPGESGATSKPDPKSKPNATPKGEARFG